MKRICVFCGSSPGAKTEYSQAAILLGQTLARKNICLVYGGARVGLMGMVAQGCLEAGGKAIGVIPKKLVAMELAHEGLTKLHVVNTMHERKALMAKLSDGFIALPGGIGTLEEFFEALTWTQLGYHDKPCGLLNTCGYYDKLMEFLKQSAEQKFIKKSQLKLIQIAENPAKLITKLAAFRAPQGDKAAWVRRLTAKATGKTAIK